MKETDGDDQSQMRAYLAEYNAALEQLLTSCKDEKRRLGLVNECHDWLQRMTVEARMFDDSSIKMEWLERIKVFKSQLRVHQQGLERNQLFGACGDDPSSSGSEQQQHHRLRDNENALERQNATLERARRTMQETEEIGAEIGSELQRNRATMESTQSHIREMSSLTARAGDLLKSMSKPWWQPR